MNRWGTRNQEENTPNFKELFSKHPNAADLLSLPNFPEDAKSNSTPFTQLLIAPKNLHYLYELIEIAINPQNFTSTTKRALNNKMTHAAIDILTNLSEEFMDLVFEGEQDDEDEVVQTQREYPILSTLFKIASEGQLQSTGLAYFSKIVTPFIYQRPAEMIGFFSQQAFPLVIRYFWSSEMCELATKLLEAETEKNFFEAQKVNFVRKLLNAIENYQEPNTLEETMQNLPSFMQTLVDKHEDKYEKAKYASLLTKIIQESQIFLFVVSHLERYKNNSLIKSQLLHSLEAYLKMHLPTSNNGKGQDQQSQAEAIKLNINIADAIQSYLSNHAVNEFISDIRMELLNYYKVVKVFITVNPSSIDNVVSSQFLAQTMKIMKKEQNNNILHNLMREVIFKGLASDKVHHIVKNQIGLLGELKINITQTNCKNSYSTQLFLITEAVLKQHQTNNNTHQNSQWSILEQKINNKRKFLAMPIASNKNNQDDDNWDNFDSEIIIKAEHPFDNNGKLTSLIKPKPTNNQPFTMVTRLDQIEGTEVLSEEQEDGFTNNDPAKTNHFYDDLGMPELPLDSDRSEEGELKADSLEIIPQNVKQNSTINVQIPDEQCELELPETLNENSHNEGNQLQGDQFGLPETLGTDSIKIKAAQLEEDGFPETLGQNSSKKIAPPQEDKSAGQIYIQNLGPQVEQFEFKPTSSHLQQPEEQELSLEGLNQMTVSINIAEELVPEAQEKVRFRQEIEVLLYGKYKIELTEQKQ